MRLGRDGDVSFTVGNAGVASGCTQLGPGVTAAKVKHRLPDETAVATCAARLSKDLSQGPSYRLHVEEGARVAAIAGVVRAVEAAGCHVDIAWK